MIRAYANRERFGDILALSLVRTPEPGDYESKPRILRIGHTEDGFQTHTWETFEPHENVEPTLRLGMEEALALQGALSEIQHGTSELRDLRADDLRALLDEREQLLGDARWHEATHPRWLHRQLRHAYRAGHADAREEIRHAIVTGHGDAEQAAARYVDAWVANALNETPVAEVATCECGCQPGGICVCTVHDCECIGTGVDDACPVCDRDEEPDDDAGHGDAITHRSEGAH